MILFVEIMDIYIIYVYICNKQINNIPPNPLWHRMWLLSHTCITFIEKIINTNQTWIWGPIKCLVLTSIYVFMVLLFIIVLWELSCPSKKSYHKCSAFKYIFLVLHLVFVVDCMFIKENYCKYYLMSCLIGILIRHTFFLC